MKFKYVQNQSTFNNKKVATTAANTQYTFGGVGTVYTGTPEIMYKDLVFIRDTNSIWTHNMFYTGPNGLTYENSIRRDNKIIVGKYGVIDAALVDRLGANRFAFLKPDGITVEYSRDGGTTWQLYNLTNEQKSAIFDVNIQNYIYVGGKHTDCDENCQLRITINTSKASCYTEIWKVVLYICTNYCSGCTVSLDVATHGNPNTWINKITDQTITGWSGYNVLNFSPTLITYGNDNSQFQFWKFTFKQTGSSNGSAFYISNIAGYGGCGWLTPSTLAKTGHLYSYDAHKNAQFPNQVQATSFNGPLTVTSCNQTLDNITVEDTLPTGNHRIILRNSAGTWIRTTLTNIWSYFKTLIKTSELKLLKYTKSTTKQDITVDSTINQAISQLDYRTDLLEWEEKD